MLIMSFAGLLVLFLVFTVIGIVCLTILAKIGGAMVGTSRNRTGNDNSRHTANYRNEPHPAQVAATPQYAYAAPAQPATASRKSTAPRFFSALGTAITLAMVLLAVGLVLRSAREVRIGSSVVSGTPSFSDLQSDAHVSIRDAMSELQDARATVHETVHETLRGLHTSQTRARSEVVILPADTGTADDDSSQRAEKDMVDADQPLGTFSEARLTSNSSKGQRSSGKTNRILDSLVWRLGRTVLTHAQQTETQKQQHSDNPEGLPEANEQSDTAADLADAGQSSGGPSSDVAGTDAQSSGPETATVPGSKDSNVILMELNAETVARLLGNTNTSEADAGIPEGFRRIYALIPLTTAGTQLVSPGGQPLKAVESVQTLAELLAAALSNQDAAEADKETESPSIKGSEGAINLATAAAAGAGSPGQLVEKPAASDDLEDDSTPAWVKTPDGGRRVIETAFRPAGEDATALLLQKLNHALTTHLVEHLAGSNPEPGNWTRLVKLSLSESAVSECIVATYDRRETITTLEGPQDMVQTFALIEFPETIDRAAVLQIRREVQTQRMICVVFVVALVWLAILSTGLILRFASGGRRFRLVLAIPAFLLVSVPLVVLATGSVITMADDDLGSFPWNNEVSVVTINPADKNRTSSASSRSLLTVSKNKSGEASVTIVTSANGKTATVVQGSRKAEKAVKGEAAAASRDASATGIEK